MPDMPDYRPNIYASVSVTLTFATLALVSRLIARRMTKAGYGYDDILAVIAYFGSLSYTVVALIWVVYYGLGRPIEDGPQNLTEAERLQKSWLMLWLGSMTYTFAITFCKLAILTFYWRIFKFSSIRLPIQLLLGLTVAWFLLRLFMVTLQCVPIRDLWETSMNKANCNIRESTFFFATVLTHVLMDVAILALPAIEVGKMHLPRGQKIAVTALFMFGALVCISSIFVLIKSWTFNSQTKQITLEMGEHVAWAVAEANLAVISASLPMLRPIFRKILPRSFLTSHSSGQNDQSITYLSNAILLTHTTKSKGNNINESSSTNQLGEAKAGPSEFEANGSDGTHESSTKMSSPWRKYVSSRDADDYEQGIHVYHETFVHGERY